MNATRWIRNIVFILSCSFLSWTAQAGVAVGNAQGSVTLVEFFDYQCPSCKKMFPIINQLIEKNPNLKVIYSDFPFIDGTSTFAARAGLAAVVQGKYKQFHDDLMQATIPLTEEKIINIAKKDGLNTKNLLNAMGSPAITAQLREALESAEQFNVRVTPTFVIYSKGGKKPTIITGVTSYDNLQAAITAQSDVKQ